MNREEQIEKARELLACGVLSKEACDAIKNDFPELRESEDGKRLKAIEVLEQQRHFWSYDGPADKTPPATKRKDLVEAIDVVLAYLEKQKEPTPKELYAEQGTTEEEYIANSMKKVHAMREKQKEQNKCPEYCVRSNCMGCPIYEKQKENSKSADSIPSDCVSDAKCGNSRHKVGDSPEGRRLADEVVEYLIKFGYQPIIKDTLDQKHFQIKIPRHKEDFFHSKEYKHCREILDEYYYEGDFAGDVYTLYVLRQKEQKPNIELIQRSWYMDGYIDGKFKREPKWIIKTGKGGPRHEPNPRYGEPLAEQKPAEWSDLVAKEMFIKALERAVEQTKKGYKLTDCDKHSWWEDFKACSRSMRIERSEKDIADVFEKVGLAKIVREQGNDTLTNAVQSAMIELSKTEPAEKLDYSGLNDLERAILRGFLAAGVENVSVTIIKETVKECLAQMKPVEWTEDDEEHLKWLCRIIHSRKVHGELSLKEESELGQWIDRWINHSPQPHWKPSEEQMEAIERCVDYLNESENEDCDIMESHYNDLKKL